jgi:hypothetical protein
MFPSTDVQSKRHVTSSSWAHVSIILENLWWHVREIRTSTCHRTVGTFSLYVTPWFCVTPPAASLNLIASWRRFNFFVRTSACLSNTGRQFGFFTRNEAFVTKSGWVLTWAVEQWIGCHVRF